MSEEKQTFVEDSRIKRTIWVDPEDLIISEKYARPRWGKKVDTAAEEELIAHLAASIEAEGQRDPGTVIADEDGEGYILLSGHRRREALLKLNKKLVKSGAEPLQMRVEIDEDAKRAFIKSVIPNVQRLNYTPMQMAVLMGQLRRELNAPDGEKGAGVVGAAIGLSKASVLGYEVLLSAPAKIQEALESGRMTVKTARELIVASQHTNASTEELAEETLNTSGARGEKKVSDTTAKDVIRKNLQRTVEENKDKVIPVAPGVSATSGKAIKKNATSATNVGRLTARQLVDAFAAFDTEVYGPENGPVRKFVRYFRGPFAIGTGTQAQFKKLFDEIASVLVGDVKANLAAYQEKQKAEAAKKAAAEKEAAEAAARKKAEREAAAKAKSEAAKARAAKATKKAAKKAVKKAAK